VLIVNTNILLSLSMLASVIERLRWTVIAPVPVIMKLDSLSSNTSQLGEASQAAMAYISSHTHSHSKSLKIQTSKGNYLSSLGIYTEQIDFQDEASWEWNEGTVETASCSQREGSGAYPCYWDLGISNICGGIFRLSVASKRGTELSANCWLGIPATAHRSFAGSSLRVTCSKFFGENGMAPYGRVVAIFV
jgi:hypothetical protein